MVWEANTGARTHFLWATDWYCWASALSPRRWDERQPSQSQCSRVTEVLGPRPASAWKVPSGNVFRRVLWPDSRPYGLWNLTTGGKAGPDGVITCGAGPMDEVEWMQRRPKPEDLRVGLISWAGSYLTYETYKNTVTATAKGLGRRQTWEVLVSNEHDTQAVVRLRSLKGLYLLCEADGTLCYGRPRTSHHGCFLLRFHRNGKWTLQCIISSRYLESDGEDVFCNSRVLSAYHMWTPRPALHVHVVLYSPLNHCYARADPTMGRVWVDAPVPCLEECGFLLHFQDGCYHLETSTHSFLSHIDRLVSQPSTQTAFHMQVRPGGLVALSDGEGGMLYAQGPRLLLALGSNPHRGEEWFILQHCPTWVSLRSKTRKFLSIVYDAEVYAASEHITPMSLFQFESDNENHNLQLRSANGYYLAQRRHRTVMANGHRLECDTLFHIHWNCGRIMLQTTSGRFLSIAPDGLLMANATIPGPNEEFGIRLANRPFLALRGRYGYVGTSSEQDLMHCNMDQPDCIHLLPCRQGIYHFQAQGGSFWSITSFGTFRPWGKFALNFCIELQGSNLLTVLAPNGFYMRSDRSGTLLADSEDITKECIWEF